MLSVDIRVLGSALGVFCIGLAVVFWAHLRPGSIVTVPNKANIISQLDLPPLNSYSAIPSLNLESAELALSSESWHSKARKVSSRSRKRFHSTRLAAPPRRLNMAKIEATPPRIDLEITPATSMPVPIPLPSAPKYRSKNRFVRALAVLATPFKAPPSSAGANK